MDNLVTIIQSYLTGNSLVDSILIGILFIIFRDFYSILFQGIFSFFRK